MSTSDVAAARTVIRSIPLRDWATEDLLGPLNDVQQRNAPKKLFTAGDTSILQSHVRVSLVGSRRASLVGRQRAARLARELVKEQIAIVSGLAEGIDTVVHRTAIEAGGKTVAVLGTPLDHCFPVENEDLQRLIMERHLALSQFPSGRPVRATNFPQRNRTMALVSHATVIVEARDGSGTIYQGWEALRLGRPLFILRSVAEDSTLQWPKELLGYGAMVLSDVEELLGEIPSSPLTPAADVAF